MTMTVLVAASRRVSSFRSTVFLQRQRQASHHLRQQQQRLFASVTGDVHISKERNAPHVVLFTKEGCTLCDKVKDVLAEIRQQVPHSLSLQDITDSKQVFDRYKYDIPVLHIAEDYWCKHRLTPEQAVQDLLEAKNNGGKLRSPRSGRPDAAAMEHKE
jgi:hypothetical protein